MKTILVCYEERPVAPRVLERAAELAKAFAADVVVASIAPALHLTRAGPIDPVDPPERHAAEVADAALRLRELGVTAVETVTGLGDPANALVRLAEERSADLIVLGAHDGGMVTRLLGLSTTDAVVHRTTTDVLVVH